MLTNEIILDKSNSTESVVKPNFEILFRSAPSPYLILLPDSKFTIVEANDAYLEATMNQRENMIGKGVFEVFPNNPPELDAAGVSRLRASLERIINGCKADTIPVQKHDIRCSGAENGFEARYWSLHNVPVFGKLGTLDFIIHRIEDVTEFVQLKQQKAVSLIETETLQALVAQTEIDKKLQIEKELIAKINLVNTAEKYKKDQESFIDTLCHEIRNPLSSICITVPLLQDTLNALKLLPSMKSAQKKSNKLFREIEKEMEVINQCILQQKNIVDDILNLSKLANNKLKLNLSYVELRSFIKSVCEIFILQIKQKKLKLILNIPKKSIWIKIDQHHLSQVLINLASNAIKFTDKGNITLETKIEPLSNSVENSVQFVIQDTGIGMLPEEIKRLFDRFTQFKQHIQYGGSGLGLSIAKKLVESMGGTIQVESQKGKGTKFSFILKCDVLKKSNKFIESN